MGDSKDLFAPGQGVDGKGLEKSESGTVMVCGTARCLFDDLRFIRELNGHWDKHRIVVNDAGAYVNGTANHWVTGHPKFYCGWLQRRMHTKINNVPKRHTYKTHLVPDLNSQPLTFVDYIWDFREDNKCLAGAGLIATWIAHELGYEKIILVGIPGDQSGHFYDDYRDDKRRHNPFYEKDVNGWVSIYGKLKDKVRSCSGLTRDMFKTPEKEWIKT